MHIAPGTVVSLRYLMKNKYGEILEDRMHTIGVNYLHSAGNILPALEACLEGLEPGNQKRISISAETSPQLIDPFFFDIIVNDIRAATEEELKKGKPAQPKAVNECEPGCCC